MSTQAILQVKELSKSFGQISKKALDSVDLQVYKGEFFTLLGPSGCGKSTLLRIIMGIETPDPGGIIALNGKNIENTPVQRRNISMVFQSYALFPHMSVLKNIQYGLKMKKVSSQDMAQRVEHAIDITDLAEYIHRMPRQLSGGQQQRVALARAIVMRPDLLLLDEPLSNLDAKLRESLREELLALHRNTESTSIYVTHDQSEAMSMSDRVAVMRMGKIVELGTPKELYSTPKYKYTAQFLGHANIMEVHADGTQARSPWGEPITLSESVQGTHSVFIRPEHVQIKAAKDSKNNGKSGGVQGTVTTVSFFGANTKYEVKIDNDTTIRSQTVGDTHILHVGDAVHVTFNNKFKVLQKDEHDDE